MARSFAGLFLFTAFGLSTASPGSCTNGQCESSYQNADASVLIQQHVQTMVSSDAEGPRKKSLLAQELLDEVARLSEEGQPRTSTEKMRVIKDLVENEILPDLVASHAAASSRIVRLHNAIGVCNNAGSSSLQQIEQTEQVAVATARSSHSACRTVEGGYQTIKTTKCGDLAEFLQGIHLPAQLPDVKDAQTMDPYLKAMEYFCGKHATFVSKNQECELATTVHHVQRESCNRNQSRFEEYFCTWRTRLTDTCSALSTCYSGAVEQYNSAVATTITNVDPPSEVAVWKLEYTAIKKITCYVDVWMNDNNTNTASASRLGECKGLVVDTSPMDIAAPAAPAQVVCSLTPVEMYPGTSGFMTEYASVASTSPVESVNGCLNDAPAPAPAAVPAPAPAAVPAPAPAGGECAACTNPQHNCKCKQYKLDQGWCGGPPGCYDIAQARPNNPTRAQCEADDDIWCGGDAPAPAVVPAPAPVPVPAPVPTVSPTPSPSPR